MYSKGQTHTQRPYGIIVPIYSMYLPIPFVSTCR